jgi:uncharacterized protein YpmS
MHIGGAEDTMGTWQVIFFTLLALRQFLAHGKFLAKTRFHS